MLRLLTWNVAGRPDHILCSPGLRPVACGYVHAWREARLSDHSAMWAELELEARV